MDLAKLRAALTGLMDRHFSDRQRYPLLALGALVLWGGLYIWLAALSSSAQHQAGRIGDRLRTVAPIVAEIEALKDSVPAEFTSVGPLAATQQVAHDLGLDRNLSTIRPSQLNGGQEAVQVAFESLDLIQMLDLFDALVTRGGLSVVSCVMNHRMDRADLQLVLAR